MITKLSVVGNIPTQIVAPNTCPNFLNVQNLSSVDMYLAVDGSTNVTTSTGAYPGIKIAASSSWQAEKSFILDSSVARPVYAIFDGTGSYNCVTQGY